MTTRVWVTAAGVLAALLGVAPAAAPASDPASPQSTVINADFLRNLPAPPTPAAICVVDTGVSPAGELGGGRIIRSISAFGPGETGDDLGANDVAEHGTAVASTAARVWPHVRIVTVRLSPGMGYALAASSYPDAILNDRFCNEPSVRVINLSFGAPPGYSGSMASLYTADAIGKATNLRQQNVVTSAGNAGHTACGDPGRTPMPGGSFAEDAICVGAVDGPVAGWQRCTWTGGSSNHGAGVDLYAAGCPVRAMSKSGVETGWSGTSFAAPAVSAVLAALRAYRPDLNARAAEQLLVSTAHRPPSAPGSVVDAAAAFRAAGLESLVATAPAAPTTPPATPDGPASIDPSSEPTDWKPVGCPSNGRRLHAPTGTARLMGRKLTFKLSCVPAGARVRIEFRARKPRSEFGTRRAALRTLKVKNATVTLIAPRRWVTLRIRYAIGTRPAAAAEATAADTRRKRGTALVRET